MKRNLEDRVLDFIFIGIPCFILIVYVLQRL